MAPPKRKAARRKPVAKRKPASRRELIDTGTTKLFFRRNARDVLQKGDGRRPLDCSGQAPKGRAQSAVRTG